MKTQQPIHNLDTLEKEIYRQQLEAEKLAGKLDNDINRLRNDFFDLARNSFKKESRKEEERHGFFSRLFDSEQVQRAVSGITDRISGHAADAIDRLVSKLFKKHG